MNRRTLILASVATVPAVAFASPLSAQRRTTRRRQASRARPTGRRRRGGLTASHVRSRIVNRTFTSAVPINLPVGAETAAPYPSTIQVRGLNQGRTLKVRVTLIGLSHTFPDNLNIMLVAPGNVGVILISDVGGSDAVSGITLSLDQNAPGRLPDPLVSGTFQPANDPPVVDTYPPPAPAGVTGHSLNVLNNRNPNGAWRLHATDDSPGANGGSLAGWALTIRARVRLRHRHRRGSQRRATHRAQR